MALPQRTKCYTVREYYELERTAAYKSDFYAGEIFAMAGGTARHSLICMNVGGEVRNLLKNSPCAVYESNLRLKSKASGFCSYPDAAVYCDPIEYDREDPGRETATNPTVIFEVLSPSTEAYDRGLKAEIYRRIESLHAYILVTQDRPHVEIFLRQPDNSWLLREVSGMDAVLHIPPIRIELPLAEIYARVDFAAAATEAPG